MYAPADSRPLQDVIRVGGDALDIFAQVYYAQDMGFFQKAGLSVDIRPFASVAQMAPAFAGGELDIGCATPILVANAVSHAVPLAMFVAGALDTPESPAAVMCVLDNSFVRTAKDLEGKTVGVSGLRTLTEVALDVWLTQNSADPKKVARVEVVPSAMGAALSRGTVDAGGLSEPWLTIAQQNGNLRRLADTYQAIAPRVLFSCWYTTSAFAQRNQNVIRRAQSAMLEASRWANAHHDESAIILAKYSKIDLDVIRRMGRSEYADGLRASDLQPQLDAAYRFGIIPKPMNARDLMLR
jgi:NitT/TauT family transport system substrate-binding protein